MREMITRKMVTDVAAMIAGQIACYYAFKVSVTPLDRRCLVAGVESKGQLTDHLLGARRL